MRRVEGGTDVIAVTERKGSAPQMWKPPLLTQRKRETTKWREARVGVTTVDEKISGRTVKRILALFHLHARVPNGGFPRQLLFHRPSLCRYLLQSLRCHRLLPLLLLQR